MSGEATLIGIMLVDSLLDTARPFRFVYDLDDLGIHSVEYRSLEARRSAAEAAAAAEAEALALAAAEELAEPDVESETLVDRAVLTEDPPEAPSEPELEVLLAEEEEAPASDQGSDSVDVADAETGQEVEAAPDFVLTEDESLLERTLAGVSLSLIHI